MVIKNSTEAWNLLDFVACLLGFPIEKTFQCNKHNEKAIRAFKVSKTIQIYKKKPIALMFFVLFIF